MGKDIHNLGGAVDLRSYQQPKSQFFVMDMPDGKRQAFPLVAVSFFSDSALATLATVVTQRIFAELEARGVIAASPTPEAQKNDEEAQDAHEPE